MSHLLMDRQEEENLCSFLEAVPRLVILHHLFQSVVLLLLKLAVCSCSYCSSSSSSNSSSRSLVSAPDFKSVSATRISLTALSSIFILFVTIFECSLQSSDLLRLLCVTGYSCRNLRYGLFYSDSKTDLKLQCDSCIKSQLFEGAKNLQNVFSKLTAVCCVLLPHNPY